MFETATQSKWLTTIFAALACTSCGPEAVGETDDLEAAVGAGEVALDGVLSTYPGPTAWGGRYYLQTKQPFGKIPLLGAATALDALAGNIVRVRGHLTQISGTQVFWVTSAQRLASAIKGIFRVDVVGETFDHPLPTQLALEMYFGLRRQMIPTGPVVDDRPNTSPYDSRWHWHLSRAAFADATMELCDGTPTAVERDISGWISSVGVYCPWAAKVVGYR